MKYQGSDKAICPHCNQEINLEDILRKPIVGNTSTTKSVINQILSGASFGLYSAFICPKCNKIIGISGK